MYEPFQPKHLLSLSLQVSALPTPDVAWYLNGRLVHPDDFHKMIVSEKGFHSFIFEVVRAYDAGTWECVAYNRAGEASFTVKLDVIGMTGLCLYGTAVCFEGWVGSSTNICHYEHPFILSSLAGNCL